MGDAGSMFLGMMLAILCLQLRFRENVNFVTWMVPVFIMGLPIFDMTLVVVSRMRRHVNPLTTPGKDHISHRLVNMGYSQRETVLILYLMAGVFGIIALFITSADVLEGYGVGITVAAVGIYILVRLERRRDKMESARDIQSGQIGDSDFSEGKTVISSDLAEKPESLS